MSEMTGRLRTLLPNEEADDALLEELLTLSREAVLALTGRAQMPEELSGAQLRLAVMAYNRLGAEGEQARREGSLSMTWDGLPRDLAMQLRAWRVARTAP